MKKSLLFAGLAAATLAFVGCNKEAELPSVGGDFEIVLNTVDTRTVNDGLSTKWAEKDALSVFYAPANTENWSSNIKFTVADTESGLAKGEVGELTATAYDWYLFYPYTSQIPNPTAVNSDGVNKGYVTIGGQFQTQAGDGDMAHLAGSKVPLYGVTRKVAVGETPVVAMKQAAAVIRFQVQNKLDEEIQVSSVKFTAPTDIVGTYYIDFTGILPAYTASGENYVFDNATLTVTEPALLSRDASSELYLVVKPFLAEAASTLTVEVNVETPDGTKKGTVTKEITLEAETEFLAGKIKTLNVPFDGTLEGVSAQALPYEETFADGIGDFTAEDVTGSGIWNPATASGQKCMKGTSYIGGKNTDGESWLTSPEVDATAAENGVVLSFNQCINKFFGNVADEATLWAREKDGEWKQFEITYPTLSGTWSAFEEQKVDLSEFKGKVFQFAFKYVGTATTAGTWEINNISVTDEAFAVTYTFNAELDGDEQIAANITSVKINVTGNVAWTAEPSEGVTLDKTAGEGAAVITASFAANTETVEKNHSVMVRTDNTEVDNDEFEITFTQAAASAEAKAYPYEETFASSQGDFTIDNKVLPDGLTYVWAIDASYHYMKASAYKSSTNYAAESWLISPVVDLKDAVNPALTFSHATNYFTDIATAQQEVTVWAREENGTWAQLEGVNYPTALGWTFVDSGSLDLSAYKGKKVQIAFKYTSTETKAGTWEVKNVKLDEAVTGPVDPTFTVPASLTVEAGATAKITVTTNSDGAVTYASSATDVATVDADGTVTGVAAGTATITVSAAATDNFNAASGTVAVTVTEVVPGQQDFTWDLSTNSYASSSADEVVWASEVATMTAAKAGSTTAANNYLGGDASSRTSTRFYKGSTLTIAPAAGVTIVKVEYTATSDSYATAMANSVWTNASATASAKDVVITPTDGTSAISAVIGATTGGTAMKVYYTGTPSGEVSLLGIAVSGQTTTFTVGDTFKFDGTVTASYSDGSTKDVTASAEVSTPDLTAAGTKDVTVSYTEGEVTKTTTYQITVASSGPAETWTRVTTVEELLAGGTFIIGYEETANSGKIIPMANTGSATASAAGFMYSGAAATSGDKTTLDMAAVADSSPFVVTITASTVVTGAVVIKVGDLYLGNTNTKNNCKFFEEEAETTAFTPTLGENDVFTLKIEANETYHTLQYNSGSPRFAVYGGTQKNVVIYKK